MRAQPELVSGEVEKKLLHLECGCALEQPPHYNWGIVVPSCALEQAPQGPGQCTMADRPRKAFGQCSEGTW